MNSKTLRTPSFDIKPDVFLERKRELNNANQHIMF